MFPHYNIRKTFTVMHNPVFEELDALSFVLLACIILYINGKQFKCSVLTFVQYIKDKNESINAYRVLFLMRVNMLCI